MNIWLPKFIYKIKPLFFLLTSIYIFACTDNAALIVVAVLMLFYSAYISWMRFSWGGSSHVN